MDLSASIVPKSDQINAEDLLTDPVTVTVESVTEGSAEQPVDFHLVEFPGRAYRPSKTMRRVIVKVWGKESSAYTGRRMTLYRDPDVKFGGQKVGGIKISHLSHISERLTIALTETRGKRTPHTVEPLTDVAPAKTKVPAKPAPAQSEPTGMQVAACTDPDALKAMWRASGAERRAQIEARVAELNTKPNSDTGPGPSDADWAAMGARAGEPA